MPLKTDTRGKVIDGVKNLQVFGVRSAESKPRWCQKGVTWSPKGAQMDRSGPCFDLRIPLLFLALSFLFFGCLVVGAFVAQVSLTVGGCGSMGFEIFRFLVFGILEGSQIQPKWKRKNAKREPNGTQNASKWSQLVSRECRQGGVDKQVANKSITGVKNYYFWNQPGSESRLEKTFGGKFC